MVEEITLSEQQIKLLRYYIQHGVLSYDIVQRDYDHLAKLGLIEQKNYEWHDEHSSAEVALPSRYKVTEEGEVWLKMYDGQLESS